MLNLLLLLMMMMTTTTTTMMIIIQTGINPNNLHESLKLLNLRRAVYTNAEGSNTEYISYKVFGRAVIEKSLVSETRALFRTD